MILTFPDAKFEIKINLPAENIQFDFEPTLFNQPAYIARHQTAENFSFYLIRKKSGLSCGLFHVFLKGEFAKSPFQAPFGSAEFAQNIDLEQIEAFLKAVHSFLLAKNIRQITVVNYPECYAPTQNTLITNAFLQLGYKTELALVNHHLPVSEQGFEENLHKSERRRLLKCRKHGFSFQQEPTSFLPEAYAFIKTCRKQKNKPLSLTESQLQSLFTSFSDRYLIFSVRNADALVAVTVCVKVSTKILLTVYPASPYEYNTFSPSVMLNEGIFKFCKAENFEIFDLGISGTKEDPHYSLMKYKERLGGLASLKFTFIWNAED